MQTIQAIQTNYKGFRFRSRLEARYAVWLDALRIDWRYEEEGYDFGGEQYLPDFNLHTLSCFMEVKPKPPDLNSRECRNCRLLAKHCGSDVWMVFDPQTRLDDWRSVFRINALYWNPAGDVRERPMFEMLSPCIADFDESTEEIGEYLERKRIGIAVFNIDHGIDLRGEWLVNAFRAFRSARFEHGESGAT